MASRAISAALNRSLKAVSQFLLLRLASPPQIGSFGYPGLLNFALNWPNGVGVSTEEQRRLRGVASPRDEALSCALAKVRGIAGLPTSW